MYMYIYILQICAYLYLKYIYIYTVLVLIDEKWWLEVIDLTLKHYLLNKLEDITMD